MILWHKTLNLSPKFDTSTKIEVAYNTYIETMSIHIRQQFPNSHGISACGGGAKAAMQLPQFPFATENKKWPFFHYLQQRSLQAPRTFQRACTEYKNTPLPLAAMQSHHCLIPSPFP